MAVPKSRTSRARRDKRRASNIKMTAPNFVACPSCGEPTMPHRVCPSCGKYKNVEVINVD